MSGGAGNSDSGITNAVFLSSFRTSRTFLARRVEDRVHPQRINPGLQQPAPNGNQPPQHQLTEEQKERLEQIDDAISIDNAAEWQDNIADIPMDIAPDEHARLTRQADEILQEKTLGRQNLIWDEEQDCLDDPAYLPDLGVFSSIHQVVSVQIPCFCSKNRDISFSQRNWGFRRLVDRCYLLQRRDLRPLISEFPTQRNGERAGN